MNEPNGWICPRCRQVNAPWRSSCDCTPVTVRPAPIAPQPYPQPLVWPDRTYRPPWNWPTITWSTTADRIDCVLQVRQ